jgi:hypothetical protein
MMPSLKYVKPDPRPINERFYKTIPAIDEKGIPLQQNPPLNKRGFWTKSEGDTVGSLTANIKEVEGKIEQRKEQNNK